MLRFLDEVINELNRKDEQHKSFFRTKSLYKRFHLVTYAFDFGEMLIERGLRIETYDGIKYHYQQIDYPLTELKKFFTKEPSDIASYQAALVYGDPLQGYFTELMDSAQSIDAEYNETTSVNV